MPYATPHRAILMLGLLLTLFITTTRPLAAQDAPAEPASTDEANAALDRRFTYQGRLFDGNSPVNANCDLRFGLFGAASGGTQIGEQQIIANVAVSAGLFTVTLNQSNQFGNNAFRGDQRWLEVGVRCPAGSGNYTLLQPRQALDAAPYAIYALGAERVPWTGITGVPANIANPPTYSAGAGLQLSAENQFRVVFAGSGTAASAARSNHHHFGQAWSGSSPSAGLILTNTAESGVGFMSFATAASGITFGIVGQTDATSGYGVAGYARSNAGVNRGIYGESASSSGDGVYGLNTSTSGSAYGVYGRANSTSGGAGVRGQGPYVGVWGQATATSGANWGVYGHTSSSGGYGGYFSAPSGGTAGRFLGAVSISGNLSKSSGSFMIDHPLDPANKYLYHSFVESPDMLNVYNGNVTLDGDGQAWVNLPAYFSALNRDFRYQLTAIGAPGPNLYIADKIADNRFRIAGGSPGMEVSWLVTGIRQDAYALENPIVVEVDKPAHERGTYLHPEAHGQPATLSVDRLISGALQDAPDQ